MSNMDKQTFLAQAIRLEGQAEAVYRRLIDLVLAEGRLDSAEFFNQMAEYARLHREDMQRKAGIGEGGIGETTGGTGEVPDLPFDVVSSELEDAMELALAAECRGVAFYEDLAATANDAEVRQLAGDFAAEERRHVEALERFMGRKPY